MKIASLGRFHSRRDPEGNGCKSRQLGAQSVHLHPDFNNDWEGYAVSNGLGLQSRLGVGMNSA